MRPSKDRDRLKDVSLRITRHLAEEGLAVGIIPPKRIGVRALDIREEWTNGWSAFTGSIRLSGTRTIKLQIWMDHWTGGKKRRLYCGFSGSDAAILKLVATTPDRYEPRRVFTNRDVASGEYATLKEALPNSLFGCPVHERLGSYCFFGLYFREPALRAQSRDSFVRNAVDFFVNCSEPAIQASHENDFPAVTERRLVTLHKREEFARNGSLAKLRKQFDNYKCKVCRLRLESRYGALGREYAEAHHIVPLHKLDDIVKTTMDDLITVCPNCHRMLHQMEGQSNDWKTLKDQLIPLRR